MTVGTCAWLAGGGDDDDDREAMNFIPCSLFGYIFQFYSSFSRRCWSAWVAHQVILLLSVWLACIVVQIAHCEAALVLLLWGVSSFMLEHLQCCCCVIGTMFITCGVGDTK